MQTAYDDRHLRARSGFLWVIVALAIVAAAALIGTIVFHGYFFPSDTVYYGRPWFGWWFFPFGFFFLFIFLFFFFRVAFWGWGGGWRRRYWYGYGYGDAREILRQRYARGEISKEQFDQMRRDLEQH